MKKILPIIIACFLFPFAVIAEEITYPVELKFEKVSAAKLSALLRKEFPAKNIWENAVGKPTGEVTDFTYVMAKYDLNSDGIDEVFLSTGGSGMCGSAGCNVKIYKKNKNVGFKVILGKTGGGLITSWWGISILKDKTKGYNDILLAHKSIWKWNGKFYNFSNKITIGE